MAINHRRRGQAAADDFMRSIYELDGSDVALIGPARKLRTIETRKAKLDIDCARSARSMHALREWREAAEAKAKAEQKGGAR